MGRYDDIRNGTGSNATPGVYDIVKEYDWTSVPRTSDLRNEAPSAYITAYELKYSQLRSFIDGYMNILSPQNNAGSYSESKNPGLDFYKGLYTVKDGPIARLNFPFFEDSFRSFSTEFADTFSPISQRGAQMFGGQAIQGLGGAAESIAGGGLAAVNALASFGDTGNSGDQSLADKVAKTASGVATGVAKTLGLNPGRQTIGTPGSYIETPKFYQYSNTDNGLQVGFTLSNTLEDDSIDKNFKFICDFTKMNRPYRYGPIGMDFPAIYNLVVPGLRYIQWAYLENFEVSMLGNRRKIGSRVIPEAYVCNFTFRSLTVEPANFVEEICDNRDAFGDFDSYSANQAKEELGFQKGRYQRERALNKRSNLARAIQNGEALPNTQPGITGAVGPNTGENVVFPGVTGTREEAERQAAQRQAEEARQVREAEELARSVTYGLGTAPVPVADASSFLTAAGTGGGTLTFSTDDLVSGDRANMSVPLGPPIGANLNLSDVYGEGPTPGVTKVQALDAGGNTELQKVYNRQAAEQERFNFLYPDQSSGGGDGGGGGGGF